MAACNSPSGNSPSAVEAEVPLIVLLWNNDGYGEIKTYMIDRQIKPIGVDIYTPDFLDHREGLRLRCDAPGQCRCT